MNVNVFKITTVVLILAGCSLSNEKDNTLSFTTIGKGFLSGEERISKQYAVIHTQEEWENLKTAMGNNAINTFRETTPSLFFFRIMQGKTEQPSPLSQSIIFNILKKR